MANEMKRREVWRSVVTVGASVGEGTGEGSSVDREENDVMIRNVFDFSGDESSKSVESFERIDDAVMGGISLSALKNVDNEPYASWSGICRTDGGYVVFTHSI